MSAYLYRYPRLILMLLILIISAGLSAINFLPRQEDPSVVERWLRVSVFLAGAEAGRVENLLSIPLEKSLQDIEEIKSIRSISRTASSTLTITLKNSVHEVDEVWARVRERLSEATETLPEGTSTPKFERLSSTAITLAIGLTWQTGETPQLDILQRLALELDNRLSRLSGTTKVQLYGTVEDEILIEVLPWKLAAAGLTMADVTTAIDAADVLLSAGSLRGKSNNLLIAIDQPLQSIQRIRHIHLQQGTHDSLLRLDDIAKIHLQTRQPPSSLALIEGDLGIMLTTRIDNNTRIDRWADAAKEIVADFAKDLPQEINTHIIFDQSRYTEKRFSSLINNFSLAMLFVALILILMLGLRYGLIVTAMIPVTIALVLVSLLPLNIALDQVSVTGLIIALGILIDNGIIFADAYRQQRLKGIPINKVLSTGLRPLMPPVTAASITTILIFLPLIMLPGPNGEFVYGLGMSLILSVGFSLLISSSLLPALLAYFDRHDTPSHPHSLPNNPRYTKFLQHFLQRPYLGISIALLLPLIGFALVTQLQQQFFPPADRDQFQIQVQLAATASIQETKKAVLQVREVLQQHAEIIGDYWIIGDNSPKIYYNITANQTAVNGYAQAFVYTRHKDQLKALLPKLQQQLSDRLSNAMVLVIPYTQGAPINAPIALKIVGADMDVIQQLSEQLRLILSQTQQVTYSSSLIAAGQAQLQLTVNHAQAKRLNTTPELLAAQLNTQLEGVIAGSVLEQGEQVAVRVRAYQRSKQTIDYPVFNSQAAKQGVHLSSLTQAELSAEVSAIVREDQRHGDLVWGFLQPFSYPSIAVNDFQQRLANSDFKLPAGYDLDFGGEKERKKDLTDDMIATLAPLLIAMLAVLLMTLNSFRLTALITFSGLLSLGGGILSLWLFNYPLGFMSLMGLMGLMGLAVNDSIVVLNALRQDPATQSGDVNAVLNVLRHETRHVLSTTFTTIAGFLPLIFWGSSFWPPLAIVMVGGIVTATLLALFFIPCAFIILYRHRSLS